MTIAEAFDQHYRTQASKEIQEPWRPRPSALGGCLREIAFRMRQGEVLLEPRSPESLRVLELGTQRGEELERRAKEIWPDAETQVRIEVPTPWGSMDGTLDLWLPSLRTIVDFKTSGAYSFGLLLAGEKEDEGYALQLNAYRHGIVQLTRSKPLFPAPLFGFNLHEVRTVLLYEAKDSDARKGVTAGMLKEQEIPWSEELEARYQHRLMELHYLLKQKERGELDPLKVPGMPKDARGNLTHWRCKLREGKPLYCTVGPIQGQCSL